MEKKSRIERKEEIQEVTASLAAAKGISASRASGHLYSWELFLGGCVFFFFHITFFTSLFDDLWRAIRFVRQVKGAALLNAV